MKKKSTNLLDVIVEVNKRRQGGKKVLKKKYAKKYKKKKEKMTKIMSSSLMKKLLEKVKDPEIIRELIMDLLPEMFFERDGIDEEKSNLVDELGVLDFEKIELFLEKMAEPDKKKKSPSIKKYEEDDEEDEDDDEDDEEEEEYPSRSRADWDRIELIEEVVKIHVKRMELKAEKILTAIFKEERMDMVKTFEELLKENLTLFDSKVKKMKRKTVPQKRKVPINEYSIYNAKK